MAEFRISPLRLDQFIEMIKTDRGFSFARLSDGGFFLYLGWRRH